MALAPDGKKVKLAPVVLDTVEKRHTYQLACERRGLRQKRAKLEAEAEAALKSEVFMRAVRKGDDELMRRPV